MSEQGDRWITTEDAARIAGVGEAAIRKRIRAGRLEWRKVRNVYQVSRSSLAAYKRRRPGPEPREPRGG